MSGLEVEDAWDQEEGEEGGYHHEDEQQQQQHQQQHYDDDTYLHHQQQHQEYENALGDEHGGSGMLENQVDDEEEEDILDLDGDQGRTTNRQGVLLMRFCPHDSSMLYPKEHKRTKTLRYACRLCRYSEEAQNPMIYQNILKKEVKNVLHTVPSAVSDDPTLPRSQNASCENCGHNEAVFFQNVAGSDTLALIFVCCNCDHKWVG